MNKPKVISDQAHYVVQWRGKTAGYSEYAGALDMYMEKLEEGKKPKLKAIVTVITETDITPVLNNWESTRANCS